MKINSKIIFIILIIINIIILYKINNKIELHSEKLNFLESSLIYKEIFNAKIISTKLKNKIDSVLSLRCRDSKKIPNKWNGTGTKIGDSVVITADHIVSNNDTLHYNEKELKDLKVIVKKMPIFCEIYDEEIKVGDYKTSYKSIQINNKDMVLLNVNFNDNGKKIMALSPTVKKVTRGQPVILISHPLNFINNRITTFGIIVNDNIQKTIEHTRPKYWNNAVLTDMSASPGSSGAPVFSSDGEFIGIHVGEEREKGLNLNYQLMFESDITPFLFYFQKK